MTSVRVRKHWILYATAGPAPQLLGYVVAPLAIARRGRRHGWSNRRPGALNLLGVLPLAMGAAMLGWAIVSHYDAAPEEAELTIVPTYLARGGAYAVTRNPMYLGGATMLTGWSILLGSLPVAGAAVAYVTGMSTAGVPFEERLLRDKFGESYDAYRRAVPRWLPRRARRVDQATTAFVA